MEKDAKIELESLRDLENIIEEAKNKGIDIIVIGGYAVRAYTPKTIRYSKDIDLVVKNTDDMQKLKYVLGKLKYEFRAAKHGLSGFKRIEGVPIVLNISVNDVNFGKRGIKALYSDKRVKADVIDIEELVPNKLILGRDKDIIDVCIVLLDSHNIINIKKLSGYLLRINKKEDFLTKIKHLSNLTNTKNFRDIWKGFMGRDFKKDEKLELNSIITKLTKFIT